MNCLRLRFIGRVYPSGDETHVKKWLIRLHRYLAIGLSVPFVVWFASGIAMIFAGGMPRLTSGIRLERLQPIDLRQVRLSPSEAEARARLRGDADRVVLLTVTGRPAYRFSAAESSTIFADTGEPLGVLDAKRSVGIAAAFLGVPRQTLHYSREHREEDQWTIGF